MDRFRSEIANAVVALTSVATDAMLALRAWIDSL